MVYGKACSLPVKLKHKAYWVIEFMNFDQPQAGRKSKLQLHMLDKIRNQTYELSQVYKKKVKRYHDKQLKWR